MKYIKLFEDIAPLTPRDIDKVSEPFTELYHLLISLKNTINLHKMHFPCEIYQ